MKYKMFFLLLILFVGSSAIAGNTITRDVNFGSGSRWVSTNGKFELLYADGYLVESQITAYGKIKLWQFPDDGKGVAGQPMSLRTTYEDYDSFWGTGNFWTDSYRVMIGGVQWNFKGTASLIYPGYSYGGQAYQGRAGYIVIKDDGNISITTESSQPNYIWTSATSPGQVYGSASYHPFAPQGNNLFFPVPIKDDYSTTYFAIGKISLRDACKVTQSKTPITFAAKGFVEILPGFETAVTGTGAVIMKPIQQVATLPAARQKPPVETVAPPVETKFAIYPNPTSGMLTIDLDAGDKLKAISIFNTAGTLVATYGAVTKFTIEKLPPGVYLYNIETEKQRYTGKIIKE